MNDNITFKDLELSESIQKALTEKGYVDPTPIQAQSIPSLLQGRDLIGIAQTGTGKTAAFSLPILSLMKEQYPRRIQTLVLAPTRELAAQIGESFAEYGKYLNFKHTVIFGGVRQGRQVDAIKRGVDILVATPGRLLDLISQGLLSIKDVEFFVLDEADRMLDMGFIHDMKKIIAKLPRKKQSLFFSATMSDPINQLAKSLLDNPAKVEITPQSTTVERITQKLFFVDKNKKDVLLLDLMKQSHLERVLVFTRTKHKANKVAEVLEKRGIGAAAIHGNKTQNARTKAIADFKAGRITVLVATDIAARGIDIKNISHVINYELPNEPESYVHRIGRTARAETDGTAYSFCEAQERNYLRDIEKLTRQQIEVVKHELHSDRAKDATGADAKPPPKTFGRRSGSGSKFGSNKSGGNRFASNREGSNASRNGAKPARGNAGRGNSTNKPKFRTGNSGRAGGSGKTGASGKSRGGSRFGGRK